MRGLDATQQTSPKPVSRMSDETTHPPNEHDNIFKQIDKQIWIRYAAFLQYHRKAVKLSPNRNYKFLKPDNLIRDYLGGLRYD